MTRYFVVVTLLALSCGRSPEGSKQGDCSDSRDNDNDGQYDCEDDGCSASNFCVDRARMARAAEKAEAEARSKALKEKKEVLMVAKKKDESPYFEFEGLLVQKGHNGENINWDKANAYCKKLHLAGIVGWRLPDQKEALSLIKSNHLTNTSSYVMWTSSKKGRKLAAIVGSTSGAVHFIGVRSKGDCRVRCVKSSGQ